MFRKVLASDSTRNLDRERSEITPLIRREFSKITNMQCFSQSLLSQLFRFIGIPAINHISHPSLKLKRKREKILYIIREVGWRDKVFAEQSGLRIYRGIRSEL
jgi:hypothetical protein